MPSSRRPGVYIDEVLNPSFTLASPNASLGAFIGPHFRGPTVPTLITSWSQFLLQYGGFPDTALGQAFSYLPHAVFQFFNNGGRNCYVLRVVRVGDAAAGRYLQDRSATPQNTLHVLALSEGAWGNSINVSVIDRDADNGRFDFIVKFGGTGSSNIVERWIDVSMDINSDRYILNLVNSPVSPSNFVTLLDPDSPSTFPTNTPAEISNRSLTTGSDGAAPSAAALAAALDQFDNITGPFLVNYPGETDPAVTGPLLTKAEDRLDMFAIIDTDSGQDATELETYTTAIVPNSSYGAVYAPWVWSPDPASTSPGSTRLLPPGGFVMGKYVETDALRGVYKAPAGVGTKITNCIDVETKFSNADLDALNSANVNIIRMPAPGTGFCVMGARTLKQTGTDMYVSARRSLIFIERSLIDGTQWAIFEPNDAGLWSAITIGITQFLRDFWKIGGLRGATPQQAFYVKCDAEINTQQVIDAGEVRVEVGVAVQVPAEFVVIKIGQWDGGNSVTEQANQ